MSRLTDTQLVILSAASQRPNGQALPLPKQIKGNPAKTVVGALIARGLVAEVGACRGDPVWRETDEGQAVTLVATEASEAALGIEPAGGEGAADEVQTEPASPEVEQPH